MFGFCFRTLAVIFILRLVFFSGEIVFLSAVGERNLDVFTCLPGWPCGSSVVFNEPSVGHIEIWIECERSLTCTPSE